MARMPRRASARTLVDTYPDPNRYPLRTSRRPPKTPTQLVGEEALAILAALSTEFRPVAVVPDGIAFLAVLPQHLMDRLAALGADLAECEPWLADPWLNLEFGRRAPGIVDGEEDAGERPEADDADREPDAGEEPEFDPAEHGIADPDALNLFYQEHPEFLRAPSSMGEV